MMRAQVSLCHQKVPNSTRPVNGHTGLGAHQVLGDVDSAETSTSGQPKDAPLQIATERNLLKKTPTMPTHACKVCDKVYRSSTLLSKHEAGHRLNKDNTQTKHQSACSG